MQWFHAADNGDTHAFGKEVAETGASLPRFMQHIWYSHPGAQDKGKFVRQGLIGLLLLESYFSSPAMHDYLCDPVGSMIAVEQQLQISQDRIRYEVFGPHKAL